MSAEQLIADERDVLVTGRSADIERFAAGPAGRCAHTLAESEEHRVLRLVDVPITDWARWSADHPDLLFEHFFCLKLAIPLRVHELWQDGVRIWFCHSSLADPVRRLLTDSTNVARWIVITELPHLFEEWLINRAFDQSAVAPIGDCLPMAFDVSECADAWNHISGWRNSVLKPAYPHLPRAGNVAFVHGGWQRGPHMMELLVESFVLSQHALTGLARDALLLPSEIGYRNMDEAGSAPARSVEQDTPAADASWRVRPNAVPLEVRLWASLDWASLLLPTSATKADAFDRIYDEAARWSRVVLADAPSPAMQDQWCDIPGTRFWKPQLDRDQNCLGIGCSLRLPFGRDFRIGADLPDDLIEPTAFVTERRGRQLIVSA